MTGRRVGEEMVGLKRLDIQVWAREYSRKLRVILSASGKVYESPLCFVKVACM